MTTFLLVFVTFTAIASGVKGDDVLAKDLKFELHSGDLMPMVGFGTYEIRGDELIQEVLDYALAAGYRLIDTAKVYKNEEAIGKALKVLLPKYNLTRADIWITTKLSPREQGEKAYESLKESVRKLQTDYVDLYLIHWPGSLGTNSSDAEVARLRAESWKQITRGVKDGLSRNIGVSNYLVRHMKEVIANDHGVKPSVNQFEFHPLYRRQDVVDFCRKEGILFQGYSSLGGTGNPDLIKDPKVVGIANKLGKTPAQVLLKWALQQNVAIIPKARSQRHINENIQLDFTIPQEDMQILSSFNNTSKYGWDPETIA